MSDAEKQKVDDTVGERDDSEEESDMRETVLGLPAMSTRNEVEEARLNEQAVIAAELVMAVAEEAVMRGKSRVKKTSKSDDKASGSGKKQKKRSSELTNPPEGPPVCHICGKGFRSWKAVFGHMKSHKDRNYQGFLPPPTFSRFTIPGQNSAFVPVIARGGSSGGGSVGGEGRRGLDIDLNVQPVEEVEEVSESGTIAKFDLNKPVTNDEKDEEEHRDK